jgi:uncharacterized membrane protein YfcA
MPQLLIGGLAAFLVGFSKSGVSGTAILAVPLMASIFPAKTSVGVLLITLIVGDVFAVTFYRRFAQWHYILRILPYAVLGIIVGYFLLDKISDDLLKKTIGGLIVTLVLLKYLLDRLNIAAVSYRAYLAPFLGVAAGIATIMANAAGPLMSIYLLSMNIKKEEFIGTGAWYFFMLNVFKVPFLFSLGLITSATLAFDLKMVPWVVAGSLIGVVTVKKINQKWFELSILVLALAAGIKLLV